MLRDRRGCERFVDANVSPLHYADDDAARYFDFFRLLGTKVTLLARIDDATRALHPQAAAEAMAPRRAELTKAAVAVAAEVSEARKRGFETTLYFVFAGHGGVDQTRGYLARQDARLSDEDLGKEIVERSDAQAIDMILDALNSYLVAYSLDTYFILNAKSDPNSGASQQEVVAQNEHNRSQRNLAIGSFVAGGLLAAGGLALV